VAGVRRAAVIEWREAIADSELDRTAKLVGHTIGLYMRADGTGAFPAKETIAKRASIESVRTVDAAVKRLEAAGFLDVDRSRGRRSNRYRAVVPTPQGAAGFARANPATGSGEPRNSPHPTPQRAAGESAESAERSALSRGDRLDGAAAARSFDPTWVAAEAERLAQQAND
jgi:hypothetical protein